MAVSGNLIDFGDSESQKQVGGDEAWTDGPLSPQQGANARGDPPVAISPPEFRMALAGNESKDRPKLSIGTPEVSKTEIKKSAENHRPHLEFENIQLVQTVSVLGEKKEFKLPPPLIKRWGERWEEFTDIYKKHLPLDIDSKTLHPKIKQYYQTMGMISNPNTQATSPAYNSGAPEKQPMGYPSGSKYDFQGNQASFSHSGMVVSPNNYLAGYHSNVVFPGAWPFYGYQPNDVITQPPAYVDSNHNVALQLYNATKDTDYQKVIEILTSTSKPEVLAQIGTIYKFQFQSTGSKGGSDVAKDIDRMALNASSRPKTSLISRTSSFLPVSDPVVSIEDVLKHALIALSYGPKKSEAYWARIAIEGGGTNIFLLNQALLGQKPENFAEIKRLYEEFGGKPLKDAINGEKLVKTCGILALYKKLIERTASSGSNFMNGESSGFNPPRRTTTKYRYNPTPDSLPTLKSLSHQSIKQLMGSPAGSSSRVVELFANSSAEQLSAYAAQYSEKYKTSLRQAIQDEFNLKHPSEEENYKKHALLWMVDSLTPAESITRDARNLQQLLLPETDGVGPGLSGGRSSRKGLGLGIGALLKLERVDAQELLWVSSLVRMHWDKEYLEKVKKEFSKLSGGVTLQEAVKKWKSAAPKSEDKESMNHRLTAEGYLRQLCLRLIWTTNGA